MLYDLNKQLSDVLDELLAADYELNNLDDNLKNNNEYEYIKDRLNTAITVLNKIVLD